ncbi:MAG: HIT family protein [Candidatus Nanopelagicales bacterium]
MTALGEALPSRELMHVEGGWRVALAFNATLPGWLVLVPLRHVSALDDLTASEAGEFGLLARRASIALREVVGCEKTYLMLFAEAEGFSHLHVHMVPRMPDFAQEVLGPRVFAYMTDDEDRWLPEPERDALALLLRAAMARSH